MRKHIMLIGYILSICLLTGCGANSGYELKPSGTYETEAPVIYTPDTNASESQNGENTDNDADAAESDKDYVKRYNDFKERFYQPDLLTEFVYLNQNKTDNVTIKMTYLTAYKDEYSYVKKVSESGLETTVLSNSSASYLMDEIAYIAEKASPDTFDMTKRSDLQILFDIDSAQYVGTSSMTYDDIPLSVDTFTVGETSYKMGYDSNSELILYGFSTSESETVYVFKSMTTCDTDDYFKISSDYTVVEYSES